MSVKNHTTHTDRNGIIFSVIILHPVSAINYGTGIRVF